MKIVRALNWKYALGELTIVIVGILLAVQIDRWNESRLENARAEDYRARLVDDLEADSLALDRLIFFSRTNVSQSGALLDALQEAVPSDSVSAWINNIRGVSFFDPRVSTYQDLVSTGQLGLLEVSTRDLLIQYHEVDNANWLLAWSNHLRFTHWEGYANLLPRHVDLRSISAGGPAGRAVFLTSWDAFRSDRDIRAAIQNVWGVSDATIDDYQRRQATVVELLGYLRGADES